MFQNPTTFFELHAVVLGLIYTKLSVLYVWRKRVACNSCGQELHRVNRSLEISVANDSAGKLKQLTFAKDVSTASSTCTLSSTI